MLLLNESVAINTNLYHRDFFMYMFNSYILTWELHVIEDMTK